MVFSYNASPQTNNFWVFIFVFGHIIDLDYYIIVSAYIVYGTAVVRNKKLEAINPFNTPVG